MDSILIENVLRRNSKLLNELYNLSYGERLRQLNIPSLKHLMLHGDMIHTVKVLNEEGNPLKQLVTYNVSTLTRGHETRLMKSFVTTECGKHKSQIE